MLSIFRSSGRFGWPITYFVLLSGVLLTLTLERREALAILTAALLIQVWDVAPLARSVRAGTAGRFAAFVSVKRAMLNMRATLRLRLRGRAATPEQIQAIVDALDGLEAPPASSVVSCTAGVSDPPGRVSGPAPQGGAGTPSGPSPVNTRPIEDTESYPATAG